LELGLLHSAPYLDEELGAGSPNSILALGAPALLRLTGRKELVKKWQGSVFKGSECGFDGSNGGTTSSPTETRPDST